MSCSTILEPVPDQYLFLQHKQVFLRHPVAGISWLWSKHTQHLLKHTYFRGISSIYFKWESSTGIHWFYWDAIISNVIHFIHLPKSLLNMIHNSWIMSLFLCVLSCAKEHILSPRENDTQQPEVNKVVLLQITAQQWPILLTAHFCPAFLPWRAFPSYVTPPIYQVHSVYFCI